LTEALEQLAELITIRAESRKLPAPPVPIYIRDDDTDEEDGSFIGSAEGQSFIIEYVNTAGVCSTRSITVLSLKRGGDEVPMLFAKCHMRQMVRSFRVDRIVTCIDYNGEVHDDVPLYLFENFGMSQDEAARRNSDVDRLAWNQVRREHANHLMLLSALSHADAEMIEAEVQVISDYCASEAQNSGLTTSDGFLKLARAYVRRLRPTQTNINSALRELASEDHQSIMRALLAALAVVDADGIRHASETALLNEVALELIGTSIL
jgi:tellurite resistance protein